MAYEQRDNSGSLFKNDRKTSENHPNATGKAMIEGKMFWVNAWTKESRDGTKFQSLSFKPVEDSATYAARNAQHQAPEKRTIAEIIDDDIPF